MKRRYLPLAAAIIAAAVCAGAEARGMLRAYAERIDVVDAMGYRVQARVRDEAFAFLKLTLDRGRSLTIDARKLAFARTPDLRAAALWFDQADGVNYYRLTIPFRNFGERGENDYLLVVNIADRALRSIFVGMAGEPGGRVVACIEGDCDSAW